MKHSMVVFITGATSGIGAVCAQVFAERGMIVYGGGRRIAEETHSPEGAVLFPLDVTQDASIQHVVDTILDREGRLDMVINNAGFGIAGPLETTTIEEAKTQFETNFFGVHRVNRVVLPSLRRQGSGRIIIIGSIGGRIGLPFQGMYSATKFALEGYAEALAMEIRDWGLQVTLVEPGDFATGFTGERLITKTLGPYKDQFQNALHTIQNDENGGKDPILIAQTLFRILQKRRGPRRLMVGAWDQKLAVKLRAWLPDTWFETLIRSHYLG